jgi:hypothetical protein
MYSFSRFKAAIVFPLILILIVSFALLSFTRSTTYAAKSSLKPATKRTINPISSTLNCGAWNVIPSPNLLTGNNVLYGVAAINASNVWAVGYYTDTNTSQNFDQTLIEHWDGTSWSVVISPNPGLGGNIFNGLVAMNANSIWAVGASWDISGNNVQALIEHWNGKSWKVVSSPTASDQLTGITRVPSTNQLWAVGSGGLIEHWDGTSWNIVSSPNVGLLKGVLANNANDVWAVGQFGGSSYQTLIEHWDGTSWNVVSSPSFGTDNSSLYGITRVPGTSKIWTVGYDATPTGPAQTLTEHWDGTSWSVVSSPNSGQYSNFLNGVVAISTRNIWAVGGFVNDPVSNMPKALIEHWDGKSWSVISSASTGVNNSFLEGVSRVPSSSSQIWSVGTTIDSNGLYQTLIEFYC